MYKRNDINKILIINRPTSLPEMLWKKQSWHVKSGNIILKNKTICLTQINEKTWCLDMFVTDVVSVIKLRKRWWYYIFQNNEIIKEINRIIDYLNISNNVLLIQNPMALKAAEKIEHKKLVFDAIDNWLKHPQMPNTAEIKESYDFANKNAQLITTVSKDLTKLFSENTNVHWIPNGVDIEHFKTAVNTLGSNKRITVGYVGKIQDRLDYNLLEQCLRKCKKMNFLFIGPVLSGEKEIKKLKKRYTNINFVGDIKYEVLPDKMKQIDIAIIPHKVDSFTQSMNPLKLYEYLAAGKPVVTTDVAGVRNISKYVYICDTNFVECILKVSDYIRRHIISSKEIVKSIPEECSWANRTNVMVQYIKEITNE